MNPRFSTETYSPDRLIAGDHPVMTKTVTIKEGEDLKRGAVLGKDGDGKYLLSLAAASDGSEDPVAILAQDVDASDADTEAGIYEAGEFNEDALTFGDGHDADSVRDDLRALSIYLRKPISAGD